MVKIFNNAIYRVLGAHRFAEGGSINTDETDRPISQSKREVRGVNEFNAGGSHEENPYGGVPQGIAPDGAPNLVEQGEVKLSDIIGMDNQYILSNRIIIDAEHAQQFGIPENVVGMTYAAAFKKLYQPLKERSGSSEVKNEIAHLANAFMQAQDTVKAEQEAQQASAIMNSLSPEERQQMMQMAAGQQGQPSPEEQQMMQQQMMQQQMQAQQQGQMAQDPSIMGGQQMPPEAMAAQGGQPSPEEMAMMQQQDPSMMGDQQPMMARGGRMINRFSKGGNMSFNKSMFGGVFSHKFAGGGVPISSKAWSFFGYRPVSHATEAKTGSSIASQNAQMTPRFSHIPEDVEEKLYRREEAKAAAKDVQHKENNNGESSSESRYDPHRFMFSKTVNRYGRPETVYIDEFGTEFSEKFFKPSKKKAKKDDSHQSWRSPEVKSSDESESEGNPWDWGRTANTKPWNPIPEPTEKSTEKSTKSSDESESEGNPWDWGRIANNKPWNPISEPTEKSTEKSTKSSDKKQISVKDLSTEELAKLAIKGKFGNGKARKAALGSRYSEVQKKINELLSGSSKKVKVDDERGGKKEVEIPAWVGRADELNLEMNPIENRLPKTRDVRDADVMIQGIPSKDMYRGPSDDTETLQRYLVHNPIEELNLDDPFGELIRRARAASR